MSLKPILVVGAGRNGSTALMSLLGSSPLIEFDRTYPYESSYLTYFSLLAGVTVGDKEAARDAGWRRQSLGARNAPVVGPIPFPTGRYVGAGFDRTVMHALWDGFSEHIRARRRAEGAPEPLFYAEKVMLADLEAAEAIEGLRRIHLLRDPRDVLLSTRRFNEKRGTVRFGWRPGDSDLDFARRQAPKIRARLEQLAPLRDEDGPQDLLLRYEDFMADPEATAARLSRFVGTPLSLRDQLPKVAKHATSETARSSVDRWRAELDPEVGRFYARELGDALEAVGYEA